MRRFLVPLTVAVTVFAALASPASATITQDGFVPRRERQPVEKACPFEVFATDRSVQTATSTFEDDLVTLLKRTISGKQVTLFESSLNSAISIETIGSTTITRNADGTYTLVQKGSGVWFDDGSFSGTAELLRFTGTVRAIGFYDEKSFTFQPISRTISGVTSPICEMLVTGLKTRH
jgi:hypothetical protein